MTEDSTAPRQAHQGAPERNYDVVSEPGRAPSD